MPEPDERARNESVIAQLPALLHAPERAVVEILFTEDFRLHDAKYPDWPRGHDGAFRMFLQMKSLMPDIEARIEDMFGAGDRVCVRWRYKGTLTGAFEGRVGDGSRLDAIGISIYRFRDGRVAEDWGADMALPAGHPWRGD